MAYGGDATRAIEWGERAMRLSPLDTMNCIPQGIIGFGNFLLGRHEEAIVAARRAVQLNPSFSILHGWLAAPLHPASGTPTGCGAGPSKPQHGLES